MNSLDWHRRFVQQARWTEDLRQYLFSRSKIEQARRVLDVGCGSGALLAGRSFIGLDINFTSLRLAERFAPQSTFVQGDAHTLPFAGGSFDQSFCHYLLLWVDNPLAVVMEMKRITRPGGAVLALAEPDYGGRIDYPESLHILGIWQRESLHAQGADPEMGRKLAALFETAGLINVESGVMGGQWRRQPLDEDWENEWDVLRSDLSEFAKINSGLNGIIKASELEQLYQQDRTARQQGKRILFVPTFYAWGIVP